MNSHRNLVPRRQFLAAIMAAGMTARSRLFGQAKPDELPWLEDVRRRPIAQPGDDAAKVQSAYQRALGRPATDAETLRGLTFLKGLTTPPAAVDVAGIEKPPTDSAATSITRQAWSIFCQSLLASNEFVYVR